MKSTNGNSSKEQHPHNCTTRIVNPYRTAGITLLLLAVVAVEPALAQTSSLCEAERLVEMVEGFFRLTTTLGVIGLPVMWQASYFIELLNPTPQQRQQLESYRRSALKSFLILMLLGPLYTVAGSMLGLPLADCISLVPEFGGG